jgi:SEC-C motif-containing protein
MVTFSDNQLCPCGSGKALAMCCGAFIRDQQPVPTAEQLMRSRYTAFVLGEAEYLKQTWHEQTRPSSLQMDDVRWLGLKIRSVQQGGIGDEQGKVEFIARYKLNGRGYRLHEISRFVRQGGQWFYLDGEQKDQA